MTNDVSMYVDSVSPEGANVCFTLPNARRIPAIVTPAGEILPISTTADEAVGVARLLRLKGNELAELPNWVRDNVRELSHIRHSLTPGLPWTLVKGE